ncbi:MAG: glycogen/starch synthase [Gammaproteobacteria bacterium]
MSLRIIMLAAEYAAAPGLRQSTLADSVADLCLALQDAGHCVTVVTPGYGLFQIPAKTERLDVAFGGERHSVAAWTRSAARSKVRHVVLDHALFSPQGPGRVYCDDDAQAPFATDATKFALFAAAAAQWIGEQREVPDVVHAHDWQAALYFVVRSFDPQHVALKNIHSVFAVHSLEIQGIRPLALDPSSLRSWFPDLAVSRRAVVDPNFADCGNPVAAALRLADAVCLPSAGLLNDLKAQKNALEKLCQTLVQRGRLITIPAGATPRPRAPKRPAWRALAEHLSTHNLTCIGQTRYLHSAHYLAQQRLAVLPKTAPRLIVSLCGPFDSTHLSILRAPVTKSPSALDAMLDTLSGSEIVIALGRGDSDSEAFLTEVAARQPRFVYLQGDAPHVARTLMATAHFHLSLPTQAASAAAVLPALNAGRPCLVHGTGALAEAVEHERNGWCLAPGKDASGRLLPVFVEACAIARTRGPAWQRLMQQAAGSGTAWPEVAKAHTDRLYQRAAL